MRKLKKWFLSLFASLFIIAPVACSTACTSVYAQTESFNQTWYKDKTWLEGYVEWDWGYTGDGHSRCYSRDYIWLEKSSSTATTATYKVYAGLWKESWMSWASTYYFRMYEGNTDTGQRVNVNPSGNTWNSFNGYYCLYNYGGTFNMKSGHTYTIYYNVKNRDNMTESDGKVEITVPYYKPEEHDVKYDLSGGKYNSYSDKNDDTTAKTSTQSEKQNNLLSAMTVKAAETETTGTDADTKETSYVIPEDGEYSFQNVYNSGLYMSAADTYATDEKRALCVWNDTGIYARWYIERYKNTEYYYIINKSSGYSIEMWGAVNNVNGGSAICLSQQEKGTDDHLWRFVDLGDGKVSIQSKKTGYYLYASFSGMHAGTPIGQFEGDYGTDCQWKLIQQSTGSSAVRTKRKNVDFYVPEKTPKKTGYSFQYWNCSAGGKYQAGQNYTHSQNGGTVTMTAVYSPKQYDAIYDGNGGTYNGADTWTDTNRPTYDANYTTWSNKNFFVRKGYHFVGWNTKADGSGEDWTEKIGKAFVWKAEHGVTLYAQWAPNTYQIEFKGNGNTGESMENQTLTYDTSSNLNKNLFVREKVEASKTNAGHERGDFIGWNTKKDGSGKSYKDEENVLNLESEQDAVTTLYAQWDDEPTLEVSDNAYMQDEEVTVDRILHGNGTDDDKGCIDTAKDREDGDVTDNVKIEKIVYPDGTVVKNPKNNVKLKTDESMIISDENDKYIPIKITYTVTDSYGHKVSKVTSVMIIPFNPQVEDDTDTVEHNSIYDRYIGQGYEWSLDNDSVWKQDSTYSQELKDALKKADE